MTRTARLCAALVVALAACGGGADADPTLATSPNQSDAPTTAAATPTTSPPSEATTSASPQDGATTTTAAPSSPAASADDLDLALELIADGFGQPVFLTSPPNDLRRFVVDQPGVIWVIDEGEPERFLDLRDRVSFGGEQGLLGLAFPPDFATSGLLYVNYTAADGSTRVSEFAGGDPASERIVLEVAQPAANHNGGMLAFGPDGYLWIGMGDGGSRDDRFDNGQDATSLLGGLVRIDPAGDPYTIPADNPSGELAAELWAIGLRNPWRFSFDGTDLWIGDVGQDRWEEIDRIDVSAGGGVNFGWPLFEASHCYLSDDCDESGLTAPVFEYEHADGCSVTGGYVYRGDAMPELVGHYLFGDFCSGWVWGIAPDGEVVEWLPNQSVSGLSSFGIDAAGEIYVTSTEGALYKVVRG